MKKEMTCEKCVHCLGVYGDTSEVDCEMYSDPVYGNGCGEWIDEESVEGKEIIRRRVGLGFWE